MRKMIALLLGAAALSAAQAQTSDTPAPGDWPRYARDLEGTRYSPLDQINAGNVENLEQAWSYRLRPDGGAALLGGTVPIVVDGVMYLPLGNAVVALDPTNGREIWRHPVEGTARRAVSYWSGDGAIKPRLRAASRKSGRRGCTSPRSRRRSRSSARCPRGSSRPRRG